MATEAGHHPGRSYQDHAGAHHLNGAPFYNDAETDISDELEALAGLTASADELNELDLSAVGAGLKVKVLPITADFGTGEQDTGWDVPDNAIVLDVFAYVTTADSSQTIDVGTAVGESGDPDGWLDGASVNAEGIVKGLLTAGGITLGALLRETVTDSNTDTLLARSPDVASGGKSVVYTGSDTTNTMRGSIVVLYIEIA